MIGFWWVLVGSDVVGNGVFTVIIWFRFIDFVVKEVKFWLEDLEWFVLIKRENKFIDIVY